jgi:1,6-anhydro-N-acetylmuramate kinase
MATPTRPADVVEDALVHVDADAHREFGPDETTWTPAQVREYLLRLDAARLDPGSEITI